jgi:enoyl-CoA hydratase/carnithine racemase
MFQAKRGRTVSSTLFAVENEIATLTFNRPEARNALTWEMYDALAHACERVDLDRAIHVFVIKGSGGAFAAGTDISQFSTLSTREDAVAYERKLDSVIDRLEKVHVATIAQVDGVAAGGGCAIALACDLRVCTPAAKFGVPIARTLGNCLSATNYTRILELIGPARLKDLMFTGRLVEASEAQSFGLVTRMADPSTIDVVVAELATTIASNAPLTIRATKEAVRRILQARRPGQETIDDLIATCYMSDDFKNAVASFLDKKSPTFTGR